MPSFDINAFRANFREGARQYTFYIILNNPAGGLGSEQTAYLVTSGTVPEGTIDPIEVNGQGMTYKLASTHTFADGTVTFKVDPQYGVYEGFMEGQKMVHDPATNLHGIPGVYMADQEIWLLNTQGATTKKMLLTYAGPQTVGELTIDYSAKELQTFDVTFSYLYHELK